MALQRIAEILFMEQLGEIGQRGVRIYDLRFTIADLRLKRKFSRISRFGIRVHSCNPCQTSASWRFKSRLAENTPSPAGGENTPWREVIAGPTVQICQLS
jgi:hypothetical protein